MIPARITFIFFSLVLLFFNSCRKDAVVSKHTSYHVIIIAGQSNTHFGLGYDAILDSPDPDIMQLGRYDKNNYRVIQAIHPLEHHSVIDNSIGFSLTFAKLYKKKFLDKGEKLLIIPAARTGSSFFESHWKKGGELYEDLVKRTNYVLKNLRNSELQTVLWHQGESDIMNTDYQEDLDNFIFNIREDFVIKDFPFILGGMVPYWVEKDEINQKIQQIIKTTPNRIEGTAYADPNIPFTIEKDSNEFNQIHYDAAGLRELGRRYYIEYLKIR